MRIGIDGRKIPRAAELGPVQTFHHAAEIGMDGVFFRTVLDISPELDHGLLKDVRSTADGLGMYFEAGLGKVNPYAMAEHPEIRAAGDGDILLGFRRMMEACAAVDVREVWVSTANYKTQYFGRWAYDRFRTDITWEDQLAATAKFLRLLAPIARDLGMHLNIETHEEITSFEVVRLVEQAGPDVTGVVFDVGNVLQRAEHPTWATRRVAPYVRQTHMKDAYLRRTGDHVVYQSRECGAGVIDFDAVVPLLHAANPELNLTIENNYSLSDQPLIYRNTIELFDPEWRAAHPDLTEDELEAYLAMLEAYTTRVEQEGLPDFDTYHNAPFQYEETVRWITDSADHLRAACRRNAIPLQSRTEGRSV
jgi:sugar phosphate isomerase/epimerase